MYYNPQQQPAMYNGGMYQNIPPSPIGNMAPLGFGGYYSGYYTGDYNRYNPYYIQQQREIQLAQQREAQRNESSLFKKLLKSTSNCLNIDISEDQYRAFDPVYDEDYLNSLSYQEKEEYYRLKQEEDRISQNQQLVIAMQGNTRTENIIHPGIMYHNAYVNINEQSKKEVPDDVGLVEFLEKYAPKMYMEALKDEQRRAQTDLSKMYNKADYNELLKRHNKKEMFGNVFNNVNIDDQEIKLPNLISEQTRQQRRANFLNAIMKNSGGI